MAIIASEIQYRLSGGATNSNPNAALGVLSLQQPGQPNYLMMSLPQRLQQAQLSIVVSMCITQMQH